MALLQAPACVSSRRVEVVQTQQHLLVLEGMARLTKGPAVARLIMQCRSNPIAVRVERDKRSLDAIDALPCQLVRLRGQEQHPVDPFSGRGGFDDRRENL